MNKTPQLVTCREAVELSKRVGVLVLWRPNGIVNWELPELDVAEVLSE
jgi:hypothetical protein